MRNLIAVLKIYLVLWMVFRTFTLGMWALFGQDLKSTVYLVLGLVGFIPIIGFMREKPILEPIIWRVWLVFLVVWAIFDRAQYSAWMLYDPFDSPVFGLVLALPAFVATYIYSQSTFSAWKKTAG